jgi:hypothetical protein
VAAAGADWLVVEFAAGADWLAAEFEGWLWAAEPAAGAPCVDVVVDCVDVDGCVVVDDEPELGVLVCGCAEVGEFVVEPLGDWAKAAVPNMRQTAVLASRCLFMLELLIKGWIATQNNRQTGSPFRRGTMQGAGGCPGTFGNSPG